MVVLIQHTFIQNKCLNYKIIAEYFTGGMPRFIMNTIKCKVNHVLGKNTFIVQNQGTPNDYAQ